MGTDPGFVAPGRGTGGRRRAVWTAVGALFAATAVLAPARIAYRHDKAGDAAAAAQAAADGGADAVTLVGRAFAPDELTVPAGTTVVFTNEDPGPHTVAADDGSFSSGRLDGGATFELTVERTVTYFCQIHPSMTGTIVVEG